MPDGAGEQKQRFLSYRQCHGPLGDFLNIQIVYLNSTAQQIQPLLSVVLQRLRPPAPPTFMHAYCQDETLISKVGGFCERARQNECCPPVKSTLQPFSSLSTLSPPLKRLTDVHSASLSKNFFSRLLFVTSSSAISQRSNAFIRTGGHWFALSPYALTISHSQQLKKAT